MVMAGVAAAVLVAVAVGMRGAWRAGPPSGVLFRVEAGAGLNTLCLAPGGQKLYAGSTTGEVVHVDLKSRVAEQLGRHTVQPTAALALTNDGFLVTATITGRVIVYELKTRAAREAPRLPAGVTALAAHPQRAELVFALATGPLLSLDTISAEATQRAGEHAGHVSRLAYTPAGDRLITAGTDGRLLVRDGSTLAVVLARTAHEAEITALAVGEDGRIATGDGNGQIAVWTMTDPEPVRRLEQRDGVSGLGFAGDRLYAAGWDGHLRVWDLGRGELVAERAGDAPLLGLAVDPASGEAATVSGRRAIDVWPAAR